MNITSVRKVLIYFAACSIVFLAPSATSIGQVSAEETLDAESTVVEKEGNIPKRRSKRGSFYCLLVGAGEAALVTRKCKKIRKGLSSIKYCWEYGSQAGLAAQTACDNGEPLWDDWI